MKKKIILIAEDDVSLLETYKLALEDSYEILVAYNGKEALEATKSHVPDLILMDIMMPDMDGIEALNQLKKDAATAKVPVILVTAKVQHKDVLDGYQSGADYYITKPFTNSELMNGINMCLGSQKE
ncbi:MAG: response regulator [Deltaproteobacteria bacterium]|nr:response regulator [Deltaproteobacteria bacterium]